MEWQTVPDFGLGKAARRGIKASRAKRIPDEVVPDEAPQVETAPVVDEPLTSPPVMRESVETAPQGSPAPKKTEPPQIDSRLLQKADEDAERLGRAKLGDYDVDAIEQPNFDVIATHDDIKTVIADTADRNKGRINEARRGKIAHDELFELASELGTRTDVVQTVLERQSGGVLNPETILAARQVLNASASRVRTLGKKINAGKATDIERLQFRRQMQFHEEYQASFMGARAETGRALNAFGIPLGLENNPRHLRALKQTVETMHGRDTDSLARMVANIDTQEGVNKFAREYSRSKLEGTLQEVYIASILSGPKTQVVNTAGNALFTTMNVAETAVAARLGKLWGGTVQSGEATAMVAGMVSGFRDSMRLAAKAFRQGASLDDVAKYEGHTRRAISAQNLNIQSPSLGKAVDFIGGVLRAPLERVMVPVDEFFKSMAYRADLSRLAYRNAMQEANLREMDGQEFANLVTDFMDNPPPSVMQASDDFARYVTFQQPLGDLGAKYQKALENTRFGWLVAPFVRTPVNIFKAGLLERSPLAVFGRDFHDAIRAGGADRDLALARVSMGTLTVASVAMAATAGHITGGGPPNPAARKALRASGWQPYSFAIPDKKTGKVTYLSYARAEPLAYVIGATADAVEILSAIGGDPDDFQSEQEQINHMIAAITAGVANNTMSKTFMSGIADFSEALSDPQRYMPNLLQRTGQAFLPYSAFRRQMGQIQDPLIREAWTFNDRLAKSSGIPGWSEALPPRRDIFGAPVEYNKGALFGVFSPFPISESKPDLVLDEIIRVQQETGAVVVGMPSKRAEGMKLHVKEYDQLIRISRQESLFDDGERTLKQELRRVMATDIYQDATDDYKAVILRNIQSTADKAARGILERDNPEFRLRLENFRERKARRMYGDEATIGF